MGRIIMMVTVWLVLAAMMLAMAMPTFAAPSCGLGQHRAHSNADHRGDTAQGEKHVDKEFDCLGEDPPGEGQGL